jgi:hypothetical protein
VWPEFLGDECIGCWPPQGCCRCTEWTTRTCTYLMAQMMFYVVTLAAGGCPWAADFDDVVQ